MSAGATLARCRRRCAPSPRTLWRRPRAADLRHFASTKTLLARSAHLCLQRCLHRTAVWMVTRLARWPARWAALSRCQLQACWSVCGQRHIVWTLPSPQTAVRNMRRCLQTTRQCWGCRCGGPTSAYLWLCNGILSSFSLFVPPIPQDVREALAFALSREEAALAVAARTFQARNSLDV